MVIRWAYATKNVNYFRKVSIAIVKNKLFFVGSLELDSFLYFVRIFFGNTVLYYLYIDDFQ